MPVMDGAEATARIRDAYPRVQVVILSGAGDDALVRAALEGGAISSLVKDARSDAVTQAIHEAAGRGAG
jgi:DNA-binding NarL/FixJ family response regulator